MGDNRLTRITTRTGDTGTTGLADGTRLPKTDARVGALGDVDELNACIGLLCTALPPDDATLARLRAVQHDLFDLGGELSLPGSTLLSRTAANQLDADVTQWNAALPPLRDFVLPGSNEANARAHLARTVCRRAERSLWQLHAQETVAQELAVYLNRLGDWLFVLARLLAVRNGGHEVIWQRMR